MRVLRGFPGEDVTLDLADVSVRVCDGLAVLEGDVDRERDLGCLRHAVSRVPGVVAVELHVTGRGADAAAVNDVTPSAGRAASR